MKRQERARRPLPLRPLEHLETRSLLTLAATAPLPDLNVGMGATVAPVQLGSYFKDPQASADYAMVNTSLGTIPVLLTAKTTPTTVADFLGHASKGDYTNTLVDRSVPGSTWQAGGYHVDGDATIAPTAASPPSRAEVGASNVRGTVAMARDPADPTAVGGQFFFNEADNAARLDAQPGGSTVFGSVVGPDGLAVMDAIAGVPVPASSPLKAPLAAAPLQYYSAGQPLQSYNLTVIKNVTTASGFYTAASDAPGVATATIVDNQLTIVPVSVGTAHVQVVGYGSDGVPAAESFTVNVDGWGSSSQPAVPAPVVDPDVPTLAVPVAPQSALIPAAQGTLPASAVEGQKIKVQQAVTLTSPAVDYAQAEVVALSLARGDSATGTDIATATAKVKIRAGKSARLNLSASHLAVTMPAGTYHLRVVVTDPDGSATTVDTGQTLVVRSPHAKSPAK